jgi:hypothetical protein
MEKVRTYPNPFPAIFYLFIFLFFLIFACLLIIALIESSNFWLILILTIPVSFLILTYVHCSNYFTLLLINNNQITIYQWLKLKVIELKFEEVSGYSLSEVSFGEVTLSFKSKSFVIYSKYENPIEIIKGFNLNYDMVLQNIKNSKIVKFGFEPYQTNKYFRIRKFKYDYLVKK